MFKFHKGCKEMKITHLSFADDLLVFCHGGEIFVNVIKDALLEFSKVSGLLPNMDKSVIFFGSVKENVKQWILQVLPFRIGKLLVKYLGIPFLATRLGVKKCKVKNKAALVKIPKTVVKDIDRVLKKYLWTNNASNGRFKVAWKIVCKPKCEGGLEDYGLYHIAIAKLACEEFNSGGMVGFSLRVCVPHLMIPAFDSSIDHTSDDVAACWVDHLAWKCSHGVMVGELGCLTVAIKRLESTSNQGAVEFWTEVRMLTNLRHCHLVSLIGYCSDGQEMILVYEYMPRGTLEDHLHKRLNYLPWVTRLKICIGAARGLDYLHTGTGIAHGVIHRDVKSSNILLHKSWAAKISDFGLSKIGPTNQPSTYVNTLVKGTFGYLDPNYFYTGRLTRKSDVYAFGVVLFEVLCRKRAVDNTLDEEQWGLASWAQDCIKEGMLKEIIDTSIIEEISSKCLREFAQLADRCLHSHPKKRPTMAEVVVGLDYVLALQEKANKTSRPAGGMTIFGRKRPTSIFPFNGENSGEHLKSLELFFDTLGNENKVLNKFDSETISIATDDFSYKNIVFNLGDTYTYKGRLPNDQYIAIVRSYNDSMNGQFMKEASILSQLEHENLCSLLGYCIKGTEVLLVYEYAPIGSLGKFVYGINFHFSLYISYEVTRSREGLRARTMVCNHCPLQGLRLFSKFHLSYARDDIIGHQSCSRGLCLHDYPECTLLDWNKRYKIILGVARVLVYLHKHASLEIIHCSVQPRNVLLDRSLDPKLSNYRCGRSEFMAPEYVRENILSNKVDVFSFGLLVLETISGGEIYGYVSEKNRNLDYQVWRNWLEGTPSNIIDSRIYVDSSSMTRFIQIGLLCIQEDAADRPTMEQVVDMLLDESSVALLIPKVPAWVISEDSDTTSSEDISSNHYDYDSVAVEEFELELGPR
ncbi:serine-threonine/tyrosine-protein kinase catalytic domain-containing protein [Tanacetum coccineum]